MPILMMLAAGAITCIITFIRNDSILKKLVLLFLVLVFFYGMGTVIKWIMDEIDKRNEERKVAEEELVEEEREEEEVEEEEF